MNDTFDSEFCRVQRIARAGSGRIRGSARGQNRIGEVVRRAGLFSVVARRVITDARRKSFSFGAYSCARNPSVIAQKNSGFQTSVADGFLMNG